MKVGDRVRMKVTDLMGIVQGQPLLALGLLTVLLGAVIATRLAKLFPRRQTMRRRLLRGRREFTAAVTLLPLALKLLSNPIVRDYLRGTVTRRISRKLWR
jgi:uncharacterized membrane protein YjgN (DUF898 family)